MFKDIIKDKDKDKDKNKDKNEDNCECKDKCEYEDEDKCEKNIHGKSYNSDKVIAWSKWEEKEYKYFQEKLKEKIENPLNWEADAWIKIAKERNNKNNKENEK